MKKAMLLLMLCVCVAGCATVDSPAEKSMRNVGDAAYDAVWNAI